MSDTVGDAEAVGAPPFALPEEDGGSAAVVGHPDAPLSIEASAVPGFEAVQPEVADEKPHAHHAAAKKAAPRKATAKKG